MQRGGNGQTEPIGLSQQAIASLADRVLHYAADHVGEADLSASTERALHRWLTETGVLSEYVPIEAARVMDAVFRSEAP